VAWSEAGEREGLDSHEEEAQMSARGRELLGLLPVSLLITGGFTAVYISRQSELGSATLTYGGIFLALCLAVHLFIRFTLPDADPYLFPLTALLAAFGLVMIYRIDADLARQQAGWFVAGIALFVATVTWLRDIRVLARYRYVIAVVGIGLLLLPRLPGIGAQVNGAYLGVDLGPIAFQPTEFAKLCIIVFLASYLVERGDVLVVGARRAFGMTLPQLKHFGPLLVVWGAAMLMLIFIRDLGSSLMFFGAFLALLYVATGRLFFVVAGMALFVAGAWFFSGTLAHVEQRIDIWLDPWKDPEGNGYQVAQSLFAQADGGLFGRGFGESLLERPDGGAILPAPHTDLIYAVIVNEVGLFGAAGVVLVYLLFAERGFKVASIAEDGFSKLLAAGLTAVFALQAFVIVGGVTRVIPLTGVTLPFVSYGGSSIVANFALLALLLITSQRARTARRDPSSPVVSE
jgi:cell division protein FtsW (lipid II flippase)